MNYIFKFDKLVLQFTNLFILNTICPKKAKTGIKIMLFCQFDLVVEALLKTSQFYPEKFVKRQK